MKNQWVDLFFSWLPFLSLIAIWFAFSKRMNVTKMSTDLHQHYERQIAETQRMNTLLERIAVSLEKRAAG
ncbi:hypothetical protein [Bradyrhizobium sp. ORS 285]|uniref:hypothetical protein n=1 Tax=Bradyrhizobium sp. ORS 285 TaxID=115808 RepID=UPI0002408985|nr:hypothetical protein [Bradyrhizobium sp. ORS 285]CCD85679.1 conserved hypothetical protein [Bradyrhizobium sp. ORS 285]